MVQLLHSCGPLFKIIRVAGLSRLKTPIFVRKSGCSLKKKKKKKGLHVESVCKIRIFVPKSGCSLKKKGLQLESIYEVPFSSQNHSVLQKKKLPLLVQNCSAGRKNLCKIVTQAAQIPSAGL